MEAIQSILIFDRLEPELKWENFNYHCVMTEKLINRLHI